MNIRVKARNGRMFTASVEALFLSLLSRVPESEQTDVLEQAERLDEEATRLHLPRHQVIHLGGALSLPRGGG